MDTEQNLITIQGQQLLGTKKTDVNAAWIFAIVACLALLGIALHFITAVFWGITKTNAAGRFLERQRVSPIRSLPEIQFPLDFSSRRPPDLPRARRGRT